MAWVPTGGDDDAIHDNVAGEINAITSKGVPVSGDLLLIEDSAASYAKKKIQIGDLPSSGGGGGGDPYIIEPGLKPPDSGHANDVEFRSEPDGQDAVSDLGFTWVNQGAATAETLAGAMCLVGDPNGSYNIAACVETPPSTPYTLTVKADAVGAFATWSSAGICLRDSSSGRFWLWGIEIGNGGRRLIAQTASSATGFNGNGLLAPAPSAEAFRYLQIEDDGTNLTAYWSVDGRHFVQAYTQTRAAYVANPDQVGFYVQQQHNGAATVLALDFWRFNWTPDFGA